jgi:hypothetical protein
MSAAFCLAILACALTAESTNLGTNATHLAGVLETEVAIDVVEIVCGICDQDNVRRQLFVSVVTCNVSWQSYERGHIVCS